MNAGAKGVLGVGYRMSWNLGVSLFPALQPFVHLEGSCFGSKGAEVWVLLVRGAGETGCTDALG